jgi:hypothetical protein
MNASTAAASLALRIHIIQHTEDMESTSSKRSGVLCDEEVEEYLPVSEYEKSLSHLECYSDNELDDCALLEAVVNGDSDEHDDIIKDFVWRTWKITMNKEKISWAVSLQLFLKRN